MILHVITWYVPNTKTWSCCVMYADNNIWSYRGFKSEGQLLREI